MTRVARAVVVGVPHHITQRGNNHQEVFFDDDDRRQYLFFLETQAKMYGLKIHAYCLMPDHVHIVATPRDEESLAKGIGRTHYFYTRYVNRLHDCNGHLWQNRFCSCPLEKSQLLSTVRYVERNPVRANIVRVAWRHAWSSAAAHIAGRDASGLVSFSGWPAQCKGAQWRKQLQAPVDDPCIAAIRASTLSGRPLGAERFVSRVETLMGRPLRAGPIGRPRKKTKVKGKRRKKK